MAEEHTPMTGAQPTQKDAFFFLTILANMKNKPDVDWETVATKAGYSNANTAKTRFGQIKRKLGFIEDGAVAVPGSAKVKTPRAKKEKSVGSGTNTTPSKVKKLSPVKGSAKKAKVDADDDMEDYKKEHYEADDRHYYGNDQLKSENDLHHYEEDFDRARYYEASEDLEN